MGGVTVKPSVPSTIKAKLDWKPIDGAVMDLYILPFSIVLFCPPNDPCSSYIVADLDPAKRPKEVSARVEPGQYLVVVRNRGSVPVEVTTATIDECVTY